jgi:hypothetical protein
VLVVGVGDLDDAVGVGDRQHAPGVADLVAARAGLDEIAGVVGVGGGAPVARLSDDLCVRSGLVVGG